MGNRNYDILMAQMTPERMAELGVKMVNVDNRRLFYMTSSGQLFTIEDYEAALQHEYNWLMYSDEQPQPEAEDGAAPAADEEVAE